MRNLPNAPPDLFFTITTSYSGYDFNATPVKRGAVIRSEGVVGENGSDFVTLHPVIITLYPDKYAEGESVKVGLYSRSNSGNTLITEAITDIDGNLIVPHADRSTNVLIGVTSQGLIEVHVKVTDWDTIEQWLE